MYAVAGRDTRSPASETYRKRVFRCNKSIGSRRLASWSRSLLLIMSLIATMAIVVAADETASDSPRNPGTIREADLSPPTSPIDNEKIAAATTTKTTTSNPNDTVGTERDVIATTTMVMTMEGVDQSTELPELRFDPHVQVHAYKSDPTSSTKDDRGMWMLYDAVKWILNKLQPDQFPDYLLTDDDLQYPDSLVGSLSKNHAQWIHYEQGFLTVSGILLLLALLFTLCYFAYVCCQCCCVSSSEEKSDEKRDSVRRHCCNGFLAVLTIFMTFSAACAFLTNHYIHVGMSNLPNSLRTSVDDVALYRDDTDQRIQKLLVQDFRSLNSSVTASFDMASHVIIERVKQISGAVSLDYLATISDRAEMLRNNLTDLEDSISSVHQTATKLAANYTRIRDWASGELKSCVDSNSDVGNECRTAVTVLNSYRSIPDKIDASTSFESLRNQLSRLTTYNVSELLRDARSQFETLKLRFNSKVVDNQQAVASYVNEISNDLVIIASNISRRLQKVDVSQAKGLIDKYENEVETYEYYRWIGGFVISSILLLMVICFGLGLFFGICGRRPSYYDDDCCIWTRGGKLYCCGIGLVVAFLILFMIIVVALFLVGGNMQTIICRELKQTQSDRGIMKIVTRYSNIIANNIGATDPNSDLRDLLMSDNLQKLLSGCAENKTLYKSLDYERKYKLMNLKELKSSTFEKLDNYIRRLEDVEFTTSWPRLITPESESALLSLQRSELSPLSEAFIAELRLNATALDFGDKLRSLRQLKGSRNADVQRILESLLPEAEKIRETASQIKIQMLGIVDNLTALNQRIPQLTKEVPHWLRVAKNAQGLLEKNVTGYARSVAVDVVQHLQKMIDEYLAHISDELNTDVSSCQPLANAAEAVYDSMCDKIMNPFNAFWASVIVILLLAIPAAAIAIALRDLYANTNAYINITSGHELMPFLSEGGWDSSAARGSRVTAFTTDCYDHYSRINRQTPRNRPKSNGANTSTNWTVPSSENIGSPPPPYRSPQRHRRK